MLQPNGVGPTKDLQVCLDSENYVYVGKILHQGFYHHAQAVPACRFGNDAAGAEVAILGSQPAP